MSCFFSKKTERPFTQAIVKITEELEKEGFCILNEIDLQATLHKKLNVDFRKYHILSACNPNFAYQALRVEPRIGTMLPCNVIVQEYEDGSVEVAAVDPAQSMQAIDNPHLVFVAIRIREKLRTVIAQL